jgi:PPP family 3-phenylpropionic acid transporter
VTSRRALLPFAALSATYFAHVGFFNPYLPLWLKDQGLGLFAISLLTSVQSFTRLFAPYAWGALSDRTGERVKLLRLGAMVALVAACGLWLSGGLLWLSIVLLVMFAHTSSLMSMSEAAMAHLVTQAGTFNTKQYGRVRLWGSVGFLVTVLLAGSWFQRFGMHAFPAWTVATLLALVASTWWLPDLKEAPHPKEAAVSVGVVLRQPATQWFFATMFFHVMSHMSVYVFLSLYLDQLGYGKTTIGLLWALGTLVEIGWFFTQSRWLPLLSLPGWLVLTAAATALRMGLTASSASVLPVLLLAQAMHAITFAAQHGACIALLTEQFPGRLRGRGQALYTVIGYGIPGVLGGVLGGALSEKYGLASVFWACCATGLIALGCAIQFGRRYRTGALAPVKPPLA